MKRRDLLLFSLGFPTLQLFAAPSTNARFLLVFLRGGYDAANLLIPSRSAFYEDARPNIAVPREARLPIDADWALHPALADSVQPMFARGELAFIPFAGSGDLSRSHFQSQDSIELGRPLEGGRDYGSGFMNRLAAVLGARAVAFSQRLPLALRGEASAVNLALGARRPPGVDARQSALIAEMYRGNPMGAQVAEGFAAREGMLRELGAEMEAASRNAVNAQGFERQAARVARLMQGEYNLGFVDVGGWDTHVAQGGTSGYLAARFEELGRGLAAFADAMGPAWRDTVVVVLSEFGRTFRENGNRGTDHGHGSVYWVMGGSVRGGRVAGEQVRVGPATLHQDRDYPVLNEYRSVLGGIFGRVYGLSPSQLGRVFPGASARELDLV
jgi:uncharacterized protein (DUF1501 family)